jgi:hypothetical protein
MTALEDHTRGQWSARDARPGWVECRCGEAFEAPDFWRALDAHRRHASWLAGAVQPPESRVSVGRPNTP